MKKAFKSALPNSIPVLFGYLILGMAYGLLVVSSGLPHWIAPLTSLIVYAGSMQFVLIGLFIEPFSLISTLLLTFSINGRMLFYGLPFIKSFEDGGFLKIPMIHGLSDETFALMSGLEVPDGVKAHEFYYSIQFLNKLYWVLASWIGALFGSIITLNTKGLEFVMTALFLSIFTEQWMSTEEHQPALIGILVSIGSLFIFGKTSFILPAMAIMIFIFLVHSQLKGEFSV